MIGEFQSSVEVSVMGNCFDSLVRERDTNSDDDSHGPSKASADFSLQETASFSLEGDNEKGYNKDEDDSLETVVSSTENHLVSSNIGSAFSTGNHNQEKPLETSTNMFNSLVPVEASASFSLQETVSYSSEGDNEKGNDLDEDGSSATVVSTMENHLASSNFGPAFNSGNHNQEKPLETSTNIPNSHVPVEASADIPLQETALYSLEGDNAKFYKAADDSLDTVVSSTENHLASSNIGPAFNFGVDNQDGPLETSTNMSLGERHVNGGDELVNTAVESADNLPVEGEILQDSQYEDDYIDKEVALASEVVITENHLSSSNVDPAFGSDEYSSVPVELSALSLEEKVANFVQYGYLDTLEG